MSQAHLSPTLQAFRGDLRAPVPLHPLEKALVGLVGAQLAFMAWALGTMHVWSQLIAFALALLAFVLALIPRHYTDHLVRGPDYRLVMHRKLLRFPLFWIGLAFLAYGTVQALNPAWQWTGSYFAPREIPHIGWLPSSMDAPFAIMNPWRQLMIWGMAWLLACALWIGLTRRRSCVLLLSLVAGNAVVLALIGIAQRLTRAQEILWFRPSSNPEFFATLIYKNHAGAFFALATVVCLALMAHFQIQAERRFRRSNPGPLFGLLGIVTGIGVLMSLSRAAILLLAVLLVVGLVAYCIRLAVVRDTPRNPLIIGLLCLGFIAFLGVGVRLINSEKTVDRFTRLFNQEQVDRSVTERQLAYQAAWDMATEQPVAGWGAGSFRFLFPLFQQEYPAIYSRTFGQPPRTQYYLFEHAHNDPLQLWIESGLIGGGLVLAGLGYGVWVFSRRGAWRRVPLAVLAGALLLTLAHSVVDFPFQNPAILCTWVTVALCALVWSGFESRRRA